MSSDAGYPCKKAEAGARAEGAKRRAWSPTRAARCGWACWTRREPVHGGSMCAIHGAQRSCRPTHTAPSTLGWCSKESQSRASHAPVKRRQAPIGACLPLLAFGLRALTCGPSPEPRGLLPLAEEAALAFPTVHPDLSGGWGPGPDGTVVRHGWRTSSPQGWVYGASRQGLAPARQHGDPVSQSPCLCLCLQSAKPAGARTLTAAATAASRRTFRGSADAGSSDPRSVRRPHHRPHPAPCGPCGTLPRWR